MTLAHQVLAAVDALSANPGFGPGTEYSRHQDRPTKKKPPKIAARRAKNKAARQSRKTQRKR